MITVSIVTYKTPLEEMEHCVKSLLTSLLVDCIYVIDNSTSADMQDYCSHRSEKIVYIASKNNGYGAGHNQALRQAMKLTSIYHLVINSDVYFEAGVLEALAQYMQEHLDVGQVIPRVVYPDGRWQVVCRLLPTPVDLFLRRFMPPSLSRKRMERYTLAFTGGTQAMNVPYHMGCFMFLRVEALRRVGLFDERYFMYPEDIDLTRRIHRSYRTMYYPSVTIVHTHRAASYHSMKMLLIHFYNMCKYFNKWGWWHDAERKQFNERLLKSLQNQQQV